MQAKTEEFLYLLMWAAEIVARPTFQNVNESFEGWAYRNGLLRQLQRLERQQLLESEISPEGGRLHRLTAAGRLRALGGRDPEVSWRRDWDGVWRLILFDVPESQRKLRDKLRFYLQNQGFGYLQNSVWISPDPVAEQRAVLADGPVNVGSLILLDARPAAGESTAEIVGGAWDWPGINERYDRCREILARRPPRRLDSALAAKAFQEWLRAEREAWLDAFSHDPLLPSVLLPDDYLGRQIWKLRWAQGHRSESDGEFGLACRTILLAWQMDVLIPGDRLGPNRLEQPLLFVLYFAVVLGANEQL